MDCGKVLAVIASRPAGLVDSVASMPTTVESAPQRIAAIREQLKLLGDYL